MNENSPAQKWFSAQQLAERFGVHLSTVWKWAQCGLLPKPGMMGARLARWPEESIVELERRLNAGEKITKPARAKLSKKQPNKRKSAVNKNE